MSIEQELTALLRLYKTTTVKVHPFSVPDSDTNDEAIAYKRIGNRVHTKYHNMNKQLDKSLFFVTRVCKDYLTLVEDNEFISLITKYRGGTILSIEFDGFEDFKDSTNYFERQYRIVVLHKVNI